MLRQELQSYFDKVYPHTSIETEHILGGQVHIQFELGGEICKNGTNERVNQATKRAVQLFHDTFDNPNNVIWILIYANPEPNFSKSSNEYLYKQFPTQQFDKFYNQIEQVNSCEFTTDENGREVLENAEVRIIIGKLPVKEINIVNILRGIANTEMGFKPKIDQRIFFFDPVTNKSFQMYDDRGCFIRSDNAKKIKDIYIKRNGWIDDYHRPKIDNYFKTAELKNGVQQALLTKKGRTVVT